MSGRFADVLSFRDRIEQHMPFAHQLPLLATDSIATNKLWHTDHLSAAFVETRVRDVNAFFEALWRVPNVVTFPEVPVSLPLSSCPWPLAPVCLLLSALPCTLALVAQGDLR
jgi:hypothetical protein